MSQFAKNGDSAPNGGEIVANGKLKGSQSGPITGVQAPGESCSGKKDSTDKPEPVSFA